MTETEIYGIPVYGFQITQAQKEEYFRPKWKQLKEWIDQGSLEEFASKSSFADELKALVREEDGAGVLLDSCFCDFDTLIRGALPDTWYWVNQESVVYCE